MTLHAEGATIKVPLAEWLEAREDSRFLECLVRNGVDNWQGWDDSVSEFFNSQHEV